MQVKILCLNMTFDRSESQFLLLNIVKYQKSK